MFKQKNGMVVDARWIGLSILETDPLGFIIIFFYTTEFGISINPNCQQFSFYVECFWHSLGYQLNTVQMSQPTKVL